MLDLIHKILYTGIGAAVLTEQKAREIVADLEKSGEVSGQEGKKLVQDLMDKARKHSEELRKTVGDEVRKLSDRYGWVSRQEFNELKARVEKLEARLAESTPAEG